MSNSRKKACGFALPFLLKDVPLHPILWCVTGALTADMDTIKDY